MVGGPAIHRSPVGGAPQLQLQTGQPAGRLVLLSGNFALVVEISSRLVLLVVYFSVSIPSCIKQRDLEDS
ncbi:hypothetical protein GUJ93_ZPchr0010g10036 [Zizania palustris]|uniref:Uncharacterized protein n=1 Tax=Zizania palustris TaxID=103762 RepID=A0A8J5WAL0_ZIZPA|nr:hypothetical protein GUJ93_ZPchr0010g10036 [Zizania palustris]